jgi:hypothetical protein
MIYRATEKDFNISWVISSTLSQLEFNIRKGPFSRVEFWKTGHFLV